MKRIYFGLLLLCVTAYALACDPKPNVNNTAPNANTQPSPTLGTTNGNTNPDNNASMYGEVPITITIADRDGKPTVTASPETADLSGGMKAQWLVDNQSKLPEAQNATVEIGSFRGVNDPKDTKPFGPDACENIFILTFLKEGQRSREMSNPINYQGGETAYKYDVTLKQADGTLIYKLDPQIIVGLKRPTESSTITNKGTPTASPVPSPTRK